MRLRHGTPGFQGEAAPAPQLVARLEAARLYFVTPDRDPDALRPLVEAALRGGADVVQLRHKSLPRGELLGLARSLRKLVTGERLFIVNDHVDIALLSGADGVHLGADDLDLQAAREIAGERLLIGASASTPETAEHAVAAGADYLGTGATFATPTKAGKQVIGPAGVAAVAHAVAVPVFAIGGIDASNLGRLTALGIHRACVVRAIGDANDPESAARTLRAMLSA